LSQLRKRDTIVEEESANMPIEIDITENAMYKGTSKLGFAVGRALGEACGEARGEARGKAELLTKFLERRFGSLPDAIRSQVASANVDALDQWADRMDTAKTLGEVFTNQD
jgi:hypothetical protein